MVDEWPRATLDSVALSTDYVANGSFATLKENVAYRSLPDYAVLVRTVDFNNKWSGDYVWVDEHAYGFLSKSRLEPGDLVMSNVGSVGIVFRVPNLGHPMTLGPNAVMCRTRDASRLDQRFLYYFFLGPLGQDALRSITSGSVQPKFNKTDLRSLRIPLPQIVEQRAVAHILGTLDEKIELNRRISETLEAMARALFKSWFVDFDPVRAKAEGRAPGLPQPLADLFPARLVDSALGEIPGGWEVGSVYEVADVVYGAPFSSARFNSDQVGDPLIRIRDLPGEAPGVWTTEVHPKGYKVCPGDIVVGMDGEFRAYLWGGAEGWLNQRVCVFKPKPPSSAAFVRNAIIQPLADVEATETATTVIHLGKADIDRFRLVLPSPSAAGSFNAVCQPWYDRIVAAKQETRTLVALRDALLPKLVSGELRVGGSKP